MTHNLVKELYNRSSGPVAEKLLQKASPGAGGKGHGGNGEKNLLFCRFRHHVAGLRRKPGALPSCTVTCPIENSFARSSLMPDLKGSVDSMDRCNTKRKPGRGLSS